MGVGGSGWERLAEAGKRVAVGGSWWQLVAVGCSWLQLSCGWIAMAVELVMIAMVAMVAAHTLTSVG